MSAGTISRDDNVIVWEMRDADDRSHIDVVMSIAVRTRDGITMSLSRDGQLIYADDTVFAVEVVGADANSVVAANGQQFVTDHLGRVSFVITNDTELNVSFMNDEMTHSTTHVTRWDTSQLFVDSSISSLMFVVCACVIAVCLPAHRQRRLRGAPT